jgi:hypothetical protein
MPHCDQVYPVCPWQQKDDKFAIQRMHDLSRFIDEILQKVEAVHLAARSLRNDDGPIPDQSGVQHELPLAVPGAVTIYVSKPHVDYAADFERKRMREWQL